MKSFLYILICYITFLPLVHSQEGQLVVTNKSNGKEHTISAGKKISVYTSESSFVRGKLVLINSTSISIGKGAIPLSTVYSIKAKSKQVQNKGGILTGIGAVFILGGVAAFGAASQQEDSTFEFTSGIYDATGIGLMAIGGVMTGAGVINLAAGKNYKRSVWKYSVRN